VIDKDKTSNADRHPSGSDQHQVGDGSPSNDAGEYEPDQGIWQMGHSQKKG
jgi:hypothetical protein